MGRKLTLLKVCNRPRSGLGKQDNQMYQSITLDLPYDLSESEW